MKKKKKREVGCELRMGKEEKGERGRRKKRNEILVLGQGGWVLSIGRKGKEDSRKRTSPLYLRHPSFTEGKVATRR